MTLEYKNLYKFQSVSPNSISALENNQIWLSDLDSLNDPFEGVVHFKEATSPEDKITNYHNLSKNSLIKISKLSSEEAHEFALQRYIENPKGFIDFGERQVEKYKDELISNRKKLGIYSTASDIPNDPRIQISNMLLWSHYGDGFSGFCLQFDIKKLKSSLIKLNPEFNFAWAAIEYVEKPYEVDIFSNLGKSALEFFKGLQCKHEQWNYECEIRILSTGKGLMKFSSDALERIYIGGKISEENQLKLTELRRVFFPNAELFKASVNKGKYEIEIQKI